MTETPEGFQGSESDQPDELTPERANEIGLLVNSGEKFFEHFQGLLSLPEETIRDIARRVNTKDGFDRSDKTDLAILRELDLDPRTLPGTLAAAHHLFKISLADNIPTDEVLVELAEYCEKRDLEGFEERRDAIGSLIEVKKAYRTSRRREAHERGVLDNLESVTAQHDLRAVFEEDELVGLVPVTVVRFFLTNTRDEKKTVSFQMSMKDLNDLRGFIDTWIDELKKTEAFVEERHDK